MLKLLNPVSHKVTDLCSKSVSVNLGATDKERKDTSMSWTALTFAQNPRFQGQGLRK